MIRTYGILSYVIDLVRTVFSRSRMGVFKWVKCAFKDDGKDDGKDGQDARMPGYQDTRVPGCQDGGQGFKDTSGWVQCRMEDVEFRTRERFGPSRSPWSMMQGLSVA